MRMLRISACLLLFLALSAFQKKPEFSVRFFTEANPRDTDRFARPIELKNPPRSTFIEKTPVISERQVYGIYPFKAADGTNGCVLKLDNDGRIALESTTTQRRGSSIVVFVGTQKGVHQVIDMVIDRPVLDGIISIPSGLTDLEIEALRKKFKKQVQPRGAGAPAAR